MKLLYFLLLPATLTAQNLPGLVHDRDIQSTFSIIAYDPRTEEWGIAVATNNLAVGASTCYIRPGIGAFSLIAETEPAYAGNGFRLLTEGRTLEEAVSFTRKTDSMAHERQVAGIDARGNVFAFTGSGLRYWKGLSAHRTGKGYAVMGNQLAPAVLDRMAETFETSGGSLAERLLAALLAGEKAGGQINGKQSAALLVKGSRHEWFQDIDLRVDHSPQPFADLRKLLNYYQGRILVNQAAFAVKNGNTGRARTLLSEATRKTTGWYGMYGRLAKIHWMLGESERARSVLLTALRAEPKWKENLPAFYGLYDPAFQAIFPERKFTLTDWNMAIDMLTDVGQTEKALQLAEQVIARHPDAAHTWFLRAVAAATAGQKSKALEWAEKALSLDPEHADAQGLVSSLH